MSLGQYFTRFVKARVLVVALAIWSTAQGQTVTEPTTAPSPTPEVTEGTVQQLMPVPPQNITLNPPEQIVMEVSSSLPLGFGEWSMGRVRITQFDQRGRFVGRVSINETAFTSRLIIFPTNYGDSGVYQFSDVEANFPVPMVKFYISLPPRSVEIPYNRTLNVSAFTPFNFTCFGAFPGENLGWQRNGAILSVESGFVTIQDNILIIPDGHPSDSGQYICQSLDTGAILNNYDVTFTVEMVSIMAVSPQNITLNPPGPIEMEVSSTVPLGFGRWSVGRVSIFQNDPEGPLAGRVSINQTRFTSKLVISSTTYGDSGVYEFRDVESEFQLPPVNFYISLPPRDIAIPHTANLTVSSTKPFNLSCLGAYILPNEQVVWMYQNSTFHVEIPYVDFQSTMTNELVFVETNRFASGRYTCHSVDTGEVLSDYQVTFVPACEADLLFPITNEGSVSSIRCSQIHPSFNPFGLAVSFCPLLIQQELASRVSDVSQCTFNTEANSHVVFVRITIIGGQGRFPFYSAEQNTGLIMSELQGYLNGTLAFTVNDLEQVVPVYPLNSLRDFEYVFRFTAPASVPVSVLESNLSASRIEGRLFHILAVSDTCDCPNNLPRTVAQVSVSRFCRAPSNVSAVCQCQPDDPLCQLQSGTCVSPFTSLESPTSGLPLPFTVCTLDIDSDNNVTEGPVQQLMPLSPQNITLNPPEQIVMEVSSSLPLGFGEWSVGGVRITQFDQEGRFVGRVSINETASTSRLIIFPTNYGDSGVYQFSDVEANFPVPMVKFYISLPPRSVEIPYNRTLNVSAFTPFNLTCFGAFPGENLGWQRDGIMLSVESGFVTIQDDILIIPDSHPSDSGQYTCQSSDTGAILNNYDVTLTVGIVSIMVVSPQNITLNPPGPIEMEVSSSFPLRFGEWSVGGVRISQSSTQGPLAGRVSIEQTRFTSKLVISPTNYGDSGVYEFRYMESEFQLPPVNFYISLPPRNITIPHTANLTVSSRKPLNISCLGAYTSNERVVWMYEGFSFVEYPYVDLQSTMTNELVFVETNLLASGRYTCHSVDTGEVLSDYRVTFVPACEANLFFPITNEGNASSISCSQIHSSFNPFGVAVYTCPVILRSLRGSRGGQEVAQRLTDFSQCTFSTDANRHVVLVRINRFIPDQGIYPLYLAEQDTSFIMSQLQSDLGDTLTFTVTDLEQVVPVYPIQTIRDVEYGFRFTVPASVPIRELESNLSMILYNDDADERSFYIAEVSDTCDCPNYFTRNRGISVNRFCRTPSYVSAVCQCQSTEDDPLCQLQSGTCVSPFTSLPVEFPPPNPQLPPPPPTFTTVCTLDIDSDGIADLQDDCIGCCLGNTFYGLTWPSTAQMTTARLSCSLIHPSFAQNSFVERECSLQRFNDSVNFRNCVFNPDAMTNLLLYTAILPDSSGAGIANATRSAQDVRGQLNAALSEHTVQLSVVSVYESDTGPRATFLIEFLDPNINVTAVEANLNIVTQVPEPQRRRRQVSQPVRLQPDISQSQGFIVSRTCTCSLTTSDGNSTVFANVCTGQGLSPCICSGGVCTCSDPYVTVSEQGVAILVCESDFDGDGISDSQDQCRDQYSPTNACEPLTVQALSGGCSAEVDTAWGFSWPATPAGLTSTMRCEENPLTITGLVSRICLANGTWDVVDASGCQNQQIVALQERLDQIANQPREVGVPLPPMVEQELQNITETLAMTLARQNAMGRSTFPSDLETVNMFLATITRLANENRLFEGGTYQPVSLVRVASNVLETSNAPGWNQLVAMRSENGSPRLLRNIERLSTQVARSLVFSTNTSSVTTTHNIVITAFTLDQNQEQDVRFQSADFAEIGTNIVRDDVPSAVLPGRLLRDAQPVQNIGLAPVQIPVAFTVTRNADLYLPRTLNNGSDFTASVTRPGTLTISIQIGTEDGIFNSSALFDQPVMLTFPITAAAQDIVIENQQCVFWEFLTENTSDSGWSSANINTTISNTPNTVFCFSTHFTSFAVLVDASGAPLPPDTALAFSIITYIGCAVSILSLVLTILFLLACIRTEIITKVNNFVLLNLSIALLLALIVFVSGIEGGKWNVGICTFVSALLHYLFLSVFSWMLCEAVVIYNLLVKVFGANKRMWLYIYSALGWGIPLPVLIVSLGSRYSYYFIRESTDSSSHLYHQIRACWLSSEVGLIYAFIVPMLCIIIVNTVLLGISLHSLYKSKFGRSMQKIGEEEKDSRSTAIQLMKAFVILLPLMGLTWIIGLFAVSAHPATFIFQIIFIILNSLQGFFIFVFHVVRHDKVWSKIKAVFGQMSDRYSTSGTGSKSSKSTKSTANRSPAVSRNPSQKPMELSIVDESEVRKSPLPPSTVMATADSQFEEPSKENMLEEDALPMSGIEPAAGGSQASLGSIEDGPAMQETEMGEETVKVRFSN